MSQHNHSLIANKCFRSFLAMILGMTDLIFQQILNTLTVMRKIRTGEHHTTENRKLFPIFVRIMIILLENLRSFDTIYESEVTVKGIDMFRFILDPLSFAHHEVSPDNEGYCTPDLDHRLSPGFLNLSNCFGK